MSTLIANQISSLSFQNNTGIISYRTVGFLLRGVTNPAASPAEPRNLIWADPSGLSYLRNFTSSSGFITAATISPIEGNYLINFNLFKTSSGGVASVYIDNVEVFRTDEGVGGYTNLRGSFIAPIQSNSQIRVSTGAGIFGTGAQYSMISAFKIT